MIDINWIAVGSGVVTTILIQMYRKHREKKKRRDELKDTYDRRMLNEIKHPEKLLGESLELKQMPSTGKTIKFRKYTSSTL